MGIRQGQYFLSLPTFFASDCKVTKTPESMLNRRPLAHYPPSAQLLVLTGITLILWFLFTSIGMGLAYVLLGLDTFNNPELLSSYSDPNAVSGMKLIQTFSALGMFVVPPMLLAALASPKMLDWLFLNRKPFPKQAVMAVLVIVAGLPLINGMAALNNLLELPESLQWIETWMRTQENSMADLTEGLLRMDGPADLAINLFIIAIIPAIGEELLFRGAVQRVFLRWVRNPHVAIWITGALFSFIHFQFYGFLPRMVLGALLGYLVYWTGSLWPAILAHFANNGFAVLFSYLVQHNIISDQVEDVGATTNDWLYVLAAIFIVVGLLLALYRGRTGRYADEIVNEPRPPRPWEQQISSPGKME